MQQPLDLANAARVKMLRNEKGTGNFRFLFLLQKIFTAGLFIAVKPRF